MPATLSPLSAITEPHGFVIGDDGQVFKQTKTRTLPKSFSSLDVALPKEAIGTFREQYLAEFPIPIHITSGEGIHKVFEKFRPGSCMRYGYCREMRQFYADNPDKVATCHWVKGEHPFCESNGSFLIWYRDDSILLDRTYANGYYPNGPTFLKSVEEQLRIKTGVTKLFAIYEDESYFTVPTVVPGNVSLKHPSDRPLAYMDTFHYVSKYDETSVELSAIKGETYLDSTRGLFPNGKEAKLPLCGECSSTVDLNSCYQSPGGTPICESCLHTCFDCGQQHSVYEGTIATTESGEVHVCDRCLGADYVRTRDGYLRKSLAVKDTTGEFILKSEAVELHDGRFSLRVRCLSLHDGRFALGEEVVLQQDGQYALKCECVKVGGEWTLRRECRRVNGRFYHANETVRTYDGRYCLIPDSVRLYDGQYAHKNDATKLHTGEYAVADVYPNFVIPSEAPDQTPEVPVARPEIVLTSSRIASPDAVHRVVGLPFSLIRSSSYVYVYDPLVANLVGTVYVGRRSPSESLNAAIKIVKKLWNSLSDEIREDALAFFPTGRTANLLYHRFNQIKNNSDVYC